MPSNRATRRRFLASLGTAVAASAAGCSGALRTPTATPEDPTPTRSQPASTPTPGPSGGGDTQPSGGAGAQSPVTRVYRDAIDSVVLLRVTTERGGGQGSGFVYDGRHMVTNEHVVDGATRIDVKFNRGEWRSAEVVGTDVYSDLGVISVANRPGYAAPLSLVEGDPAVGTRVVALGNPFGREQSVSAGIVSGVNRSLPGPNDFSIPDAIQTDAAVNPGNSGGPLLNIGGEVLGVISSGQGGTIGFAISAALTRRVVPELIDDGEYRHSFMGVRLVEVGPRIAEANDLDRPRGILVVDVMPDGPSAEVLEPSEGGTVTDGVSIPTGGDIIVGIDGRQITSQEMLATYLALHTRPGDTIDVTVIRDGQRETVQLTLGSRPDAV